MHHVYLNAINLPLTSEIFFLSIKKNEFISNMASLFHLRKAFHRALLDQFKTDQGTINSKIVHLEALFITLDFHYFV